MDADCFKQVVNLGVTALCFEALPDSTQVSFGKLPIYMQSIADGSAIRIHPIGTNRVDKTCGAGLQGDPTIIATRLSWHCYSWVT